ncbi:hypothetical protein GOP47_0009620 [Adiantum capillus-veneris]|uniref:Uncharacterized protein n=1 Tax=Adiantum capillus-veneris TaxID=13818 RepID=A0A9D4UWY7_ADICA|nr:hypothetical protein GOP47_0009620 [Adiantum capillus-veneris]
MSPGPHAWDLGLRRNGFSPHTQTSLIDASLRLCTTCTLVGNALIDMIRARGSGCGRIASFQTDAIPGRVSRCRYNCLLL